MGQMADTGACGRGNQTTVTHSGNSVEGSGHEARRAEPSPELVAARLRSGSALVSDHLIVREITERHVNKHG